MSTAGMDESLSRALWEMDLSAWDELTSGLLEGVPSLSARETVGALLEGESLGGWIASALADALLGSVRALLPYVAVIFALALIGALTDRMAEERGGSARAAAALCRLVCAAPLAALFGDMLAQGTQAAVRLAGFTSAVMPTLTAMLTAIGGARAAAVLTPLTSAAATGVSAAAGGVASGAIALCGALAVAGGISDGLGAGKLLSALKTACVWALSITFSVFAALAAAGAAGAAAGDSAAYLTARYAVDNYVPVVGGFFKDTFELMAGACAALKRAVGVGGMLWAVLLTLAPLLRIGACCVLLRLCGAMVGAVGGSSAGMIGDFASVLELLAAALAAAGGMFLVLLAAAGACGGAL